MIEIFEKYDTETWKDIPGYEGLYQCSNVGRVKSLDKKEEGGRREFIRPEKILKQGLHRDGYLKTTLFINRLSKTFQSHRLIAITFIPNPENKRQVNHKNGVKTDNRVENLEWNTQSENTRHAFDNGLKRGNKGEAHPFAQLTKETVWEIRSLYFVCGKTINFLSEVFGLNYRHIHKIVNRQLWKHI